MHTHIYQYFYLITSLCLSLSSQKSLHPKHRYCDLGIDCVSTQPRVFLPRCFKKKDDTLDSAKSLGKESGGGQGKLRAKRGCVHDACVCALLYMNLCARCWGRGMCGGGRLFLYDMRMFYWLSWWAVYLHSAPWLTLDRRRWNSKADHWIRISSRENMRSEKR